MPPERGAARLACRGVNKWFGELHVLQDIDLTVARGEVVVVIGPSGSGKSTLCRAINRLETHRHGRRSRIDGEPLPAGGQGAGPAARRRRHGVPVLQPLRPQDDARERHARADQGPQAEARPTAEKRGTRAARAGRRRPTRPTSTPRSSPAASSSAWPSPARSRWSPKVMLFDEPTSALDPEMINEVLDVMVGARPGRHDDGRRHPRDGLRPLGGQPRRVHGRRPRSSRRPTPEEFFTNPQSDRAKDFLVQDPQALTAAVQPTRTTQRTDDMQEFTMRPQPVAAPWPLVARPRRPAAATTTAASTEPTVEREPRVRGRHDDGRARRGGHDHRRHEVRPARLRPAGPRGRAARASTSRSPRSSPARSASPRRTSAGRRRPPTSASRSSRTARSTCVVATYTINDERKQRITFAGPYYVAGQMLMVAADNDDDHRARGPQGQPGRQGLLGHRLDAVGEHQASTSPTTTSWCSSTSTTSAPTP